MDLKLGTILYNLHVSHGENTTFAERGTAPIVYWDAGDLSDSSYEIITHVEVPIPAPESVARFYKISQRRDLGHDLCAVFHCWHDDQHT